MGNMINQRLSEAMTREMNNSVGRRRRFWSWGTCIAEAGLTRFKSGCPDLTVQKAVLRDADGLLVAKSIVTTFPAVQ